MKNERPLIREPRIERGANGEITYLACDFGPHHFVEVQIEDGKVVFAMGVMDPGSWTPS